MNLRRLYHNSFLLPVIITLTYFGLFFECVTYRGFLWNHFFINTSALLLFIILIIFYYLLFKKIAISKELVVTFRLNKILFIFLLSIYVFFQILEINVYPNYVYSNFHIVPANFLYPLVFSGYLLTVQKLSACRLKDKEIVKNITILIIVIGLLVFSLSYGSILAGNVVKDNLFIVKNFNFTNEEKFNEDSGYIFYSLARLINEKTDESSRILIPPQISPYDKTGNVGYFRYFIYPRYPINGSSTNLSLNGVDYILIVRGEGDKSQPELFFWPTEKIKAEKIYYIDMGGTFKETEGDYYPEKFNGLGGLIKLVK